MTLLSSFSATPFFSSYGFICVLSSGLMYLHHLSRYQTPISSPPDIQLIPLFPCIAASRIAVQSVSHVSRNASNPLALSIAVGFWFSFRVYGAVLQVIVSLFRCLRELYALASSSSHSHRHVTGTLVSANGIGRCGPRGLRLYCKRVLRGDSVPVIAGSAHRRAKPT